MVRQRLSTTVFKPPLGDAEAYYRGTSALLAKVAFELGHANVAAGREIATHPTAHSVSPRSSALVGDD